MKNAAAIDHSLCRRDDQRHAFEAVKASLKLASHKCCHKRCHQRCLQWPMYGCRSLVALLAFYVFTIVSAQTLVDEIWHTTAPGSSPSFNIAYIVTSGAPDATAALLGSTATMHFSRAHSALDSMLYHASQSSGCAHSTGTPAATVGRVDRPMELMCARRRSS